METNKNMGGMESYEEIPFWISKPKNFKKGIRDFARFNDLNQAMGLIARRAEPETWMYGTEKPTGNYSHYPILESYLYIVIKRLEYEEKVLKLPNRIVVSEAKKQDEEGKVFRTTVCAINTGLLSKGGRWIYMLFEGNRDKRPDQPKWYFKYVTSDTASQDFAPFRSRLPEPPDFYKSSQRSTVHFSHDVETVNYRHILIKHVERLPIEFLQTHFKNYFKAEGRVLTTKEDWARFRQYIDKAEEEDSFEFENAITLFKKAIDKACSRAKRYDSDSAKIYRPENQSVGFFLPLYLTEPKSPTDFEVGIIVDKDIRGSYIVRTIYRTSMAYPRIRALGAHKRNWLNPRSIRKWKEPQNGDITNNTQESAPSQKPANRQTTSSGLLSQSNLPERNVRGHGFVVVANKIDEIGTEGKKGTFYPVTAKRITVGRKSNSSTSDIQIPSNRFMSRAHITLIKDDGCYKLEAANYTNPPVVNGHPIKEGESYTLKDGDLITLGECILKWISKI